MHIMMNDGWMEWHSMLTFNLKCSELIEKYFMKFRLFFVRSSKNLKRIFAYYHFQTPALVLKCPFILYISASTYSDNCHHRIFAIRIQVSSFVEYNIFF